MTEEERENTLNTTDVIRNTPFEYELTADQTILQFPQPHQYTMGLGPTTFGMVINIPPTPPSLAG